MNSSTASGEATHSFQFLCCGGQSGLDCGDLTEPALFLGLLKPIDEVGVDTFQSRYLGWVDPE